MVDKKVKKSVKSEKLKKILNEKDNLIVNLKKPVNMTEASLLAYSLYKTYNNSPLLQLAAKKVKDSILKYTIISKEKLKNIFMDKYEIVGVLSKGIFGKALIAKHKDTGEKHVLKQTKVQPNNPMYKFLVKEIDILKFLKKNKQCSKYVNTYVNDIINNGSHFVVTKYIENFEILGKNVDFKKDEIKKTLIFNLIKGLACLHKNDIAHLDIKPNNILANKDTGDIKYVDFGISCLKNCYTADTVTLSYKSPELISKALENKDISNVKISLSDAKKADIWALGATIYFLIYPSKKGIPVDPVEPGAYDNEHDEINNIIKSCLTPFIKNRPDIKKVVKMLEKTSYNIGRDKSIWEKIVGFFV